MSLVVYNPDGILEIALAERFDVHLFDDAEIISGALPTNTGALVKDSRLKIVIKYWWLWQGTDEPVIDLSWADLIICYTGELINGPWDWYYQKTTQHFNNNNFITIADAADNLPDFPKHRVYLDLGNWFSQMVETCYYQEWNILQSKAKVFDVLLGASKPHRNFIFDQLKKHNLLDQCFVNITSPGKTELAYDYQSPDLHLYDDPAITDQARRQPTGNNIVGLSNGKSISRSIPIEIYKNSWYSVVAETQSSSCVFFTEKTAKPLYIKRLFVMFGAKGSLQRLQQQGYRTFHGIIDESYDQESNDLTRWSMAFEQLCKLAKYDHEEVYREIAPIIIHNHNHICDHSYRLTGLKNFLDQSLAQHITKINRFDLLSF